MTSQVRNLRCRSIGVREATDLIRMVSGFGKGGVGVGVGVVLIGWHCAN